MTPHRRQRRTRDYFERMLRDAGYKVTPARLDVLRTLANAGRPLSAADVSRRVRQRHVNYVTIYRSLNAFEEGHIVRRVPLERDSAHYELADVHEHHFICSGCGRVETFQSCALEQIERDILRQTDGFSQITHHSMQVYGICRRCKR